MSHECWAPKFWALTALAGAFAAAASSSEWPLEHGRGTGALPNAPMITIGSNDGCRGDGATDCTAALVAAITKLGQRGTGAVVIPGPGRYLTGPLLLNGTANLTLRIEAGATLVSLGIQLAWQSRWPIVPGNSARCSGVFGF